jgi:Protein of unknown function (DUF2958)
MNGTDEPHDRYVERWIATRGHALLPPEIAANLPPLYETENDPDARAIVKFFSPYSGWTWWAFEFDPDAQKFFGFVRGAESEWGYFGLEELDCDRNGLPLVERDLYISGDEMPRKGDFA